MANNSKNMKKNQNGLSDISVEDVDVDQLSYLLSVRAIERNYVVDFMSQLRGDEAKRTTITNKILNTMVTLDKHGKRLPDLKYLSATENSIQYEEVKFTLPVKDLCTKSEGPSYYVSKQCPINAGSSSSSYNLDSLSDEESTNPDSQQEVEYAFPYANVDEFPPNWKGKSRALVVKKKNCPVKQYVVKSGTLAKVQSPVSAKVPENSPIKSKYNYEEFSKETAQLEEELFNCWKNDTFYSSPDRIVSVSPIKSIISAASSDSSLTTQAKFSDEDLSNYQDELPEYSKKKPLFDFVELPEMENGEMTYTKRNSGLSIDNETKRAKVDQHPLKPGEEMEVIFDNKTEMD